MTIDPESFKAGMRHLAGHVCLITTRSPEGVRSGLTATAVCSVSAEPPLLLCCINRAAQSQEAIRSNGLFAVNVLAIEDRALAERFAGPISGDLRFEQGDWRVLETGAPVLTTALVSFDCRLQRAVEAGTHAIFFGEIHALQLREQLAAPLLYAHGNYGAFASAATHDIPAAIPGEMKGLLWTPSWEQES